MIDWDEINAYRQPELRDIVIETATIVQDKIAALRMGVYSEERDGDLLAVLEEIERILR
jgi:hypothetical protein